ncbi:serine/arginine-rich splicing factor 7-like [Prorops nasuta]|uniref:serine/arginine-rich splicing factor 7-like n=1 Tax=Prorops nasuta TaxID=863751 RepID=UPI0034CEAAAD
MSRHSSDCTVYVGDLGSRATQDELQREFSYYGPLKNVWVARNPPGFAFIQFEDGRDAEDAVRALDGRTMCGRRVRVELSNGKRMRDRGFNRRGGGRPFHPDDKCFGCGERGHYAKDCHQYRGSRRKRSYTRSRSRSKTRSRSRSRSRTRSRSKSRSNRSRTRSSSRSRSNSRDRRTKRTAKNSRNSTSKNRNSRRSRTNSKSGSRSRSR